MNQQIVISITPEELKSIIREAVKEELNYKQEKELMSFKETCEYLGISTSALNKWKSENKIPFKKLGKRIFFSRTEITEALKNSKYYKFRELV